MSKIFIISPHRSATTSTQRYLEAHGLTCIHWIGGGGGKAGRGTRGGS